MERRGVIVFPEINLTDEEQISFTPHAGATSHKAGEQRDGQDKDSVYPITMDSSINPNADYLKGAFFWHIDGTMSDMPILASIMQLSTAPCHSRRRDGILQYLCRLGRSARGRRRKSNVPGRPTPCGAHNSITIRQPTKAQALAVNQQEHAAACCGSARPQQVGAGRDSAAGRRHGHRRERGPAVAVA